VADPYKYFRVEARELLEGLGKGILDLEKGRYEADLVPRLLRLAHTLKGAARVVKQKEIAEASHALEDHLAPLRDGARGVPRAELDAMLALLDGIAARVDALAPAPETPAVPSAQAPSDESFRTLRADVAEIDGILEGVASARASVGALRPGLESLGRAGLAAARVARDARALGGAPGRLGALAEELSGLARSLERELGGALERAERELDQLRDAGEHLRLVPAGVVWTSLERGVRDAARSLGKQALFRGEGGEIRLDGHVLGILQPALLQLVRNGVAHGIEAPAERARLGKPPDGVVTVEVVRRGGRVAFRCRDDGRGVDWEAVRGALEKKKGRLRTGGSSEDLLRELLEGGGVSTSDSLTEVAGRGVGLDVVRGAVREVGGELTAVTRAGEGTLFEIVVPVSLATLDALLVEAASEVAAIPMDGVRRALRLPAQEIVGGAPSVAYDGALIPFVPLARCLDHATSADRSVRDWTAVVVAAPDGLAAIGVDRLLGVANILARPLPPMTPAVAAIVGASPDPSGTPRLLLDPSALVGAARRSGALPARVAEPLPPVLVVDDSLTTRMLEQSILESAGYEVELATSGEEALQKLGRRRYALLLVDVEMPGIDGFGVVQRMQSDPDLRKTPAILVTSRSSPEDRARGLEAGAKAYVVKSEFDQVDLLARIRTLVGGR
jgi:two-component system chemotaxis sensor kinase CheA